MNINYLPSELHRIVFEYDDTYKIKFKTSPDIPSTTS